MDATNHEPPEAMPWLQADKVGRSGVVQEEEGELSFLPLASVTVLAFTAYLPSLWDPDRGAPTS
jgi:hypothetical protein